MSKTIGRRLLNVAVAIFFLTWAFGGPLFGVFNFPLHTEEARAAGGSVYIARAPGTNLITNIDGTEHTLTYDTEVKSSPDITRQTGNQAFRIQNTGRYLIIANTRFSTADIGNNNRHVMRTSIKVGGTVLPSVYGMASGYGRDSGNADEDGVVVAAYIDHTVVGGSGDDITVHVQNFGDTSVSLADQIANQSGIQIIRMPDNSAYLQVKNTTGFTYTGTLGFSLADPTWSEFGWTSQDAETDPAVLEWVSGNDITLKSAGHYMVIYSVRGDTSGSHRRGAGYRLTLNDTEVPASSVHSYMRGSDGAVESWTQWAGIIDASANDILNIDAGGTGEVAGGTMTEAAMTVVKLPDTADYVRIRYDSSRAGETTGAYPFNQEDEDTAGVHDNATNNSRINGSAANHDWLLFGSWWLRNTAADGTRTSEHFRWFRTGTEVQYGSGLSYTRGDQSTTGVPAGGRNAIIVADSLGTGEYIETNMRLESGTGNQHRDFVGDKVGITGVAIDTLFATGGTLTADIVDSGGTPVSSPTFAMGSKAFDWASQTSTGTFGVSSEKIRVDNSTGSAQWVLSIAASNTTDLWTDGTHNYDFNDPTAGAGDGGDADSYGGQMTVNPSVSTITPQSGCSTTGLTKGTSTAFNEGTTDSITLVTAGATAATSCYWDITGVGISQTIPAEQNASSGYNIDIVVSVVAS